MTEERASKAWATIRLTEELAWKIARWLLVGVCAVIVRYAPVAWDYLQELERMPAMRAAIADLQASSVDRAALDRDAATARAEDRALLVFVMERQLSLEAADAEPRRERKAAAAAAAVTAFREAIAMRRPPFEAVAIARAARVP